MLQSALLRAKRLLVPRQSLRSLCTQKKTAVKASRLRNIGIIAHVDAGKTTTAERMLYYSGKTTRVGDVDTGDTVMDYAKMERERGITINSAAITFQWEGFTFNLIDTPGHVDFTMEVERAVRVLDGAVAILDAVSGVQAQTETVWAQADRYKVPRIAYINKMDRDGASLHHAVAAMEARLGCYPIIMQIPIGVSRSFQGAVDLVTMETISWSDHDHGLHITREPLDSSNARIWELAQEARANMIDKISQIDDEFVEYCLSDAADAANPPPDVIRAAVRRSTLALKAVPVFVGSSLRNKGVHPIMDAVIDFLPSPEEKAIVESVDEEGILKPIKCDPKGPLVAQAFKVVHDVAKGLIVYLRVYSGTLSFGPKVFNVNKGQHERVMRLMRVTAATFEDIKEVKAGDIVAATGFRHTSTGDTIVSDKDPRVTVAGVKIPEPVFFCSIMAESASQEEALKAALNSMQLEDPSFSWKINKDTGQWQVSGMGELHLEIIQDRLLNHYKVPFIIGPVSIAYRSTVDTTIEGRFERSYNTSPIKQETAAMTLTIEPLERGSGNVIEIDSMATSSFPEVSKKLKNEVTQAVRAGLEDALRSGVPAGFPLQDVSISVSDIEYVTGTTAHVYNICAIQAVWELVKTKGVRLMEPIMEVVLTVDELHYGTAMADLTSRRRGQVQEVQQLSGTKKEVHAHVPLKELLGYSTDLRSQTKGNASFSMDFDRYELLQPFEQKNVLEKYGYFEFVK